MRIERYIHDPKIGLRIGPNRLGDRAMKRELAAIRAERQVINSHRDSGDFFRASTSGRNAVNIRGREFVIRLVDTLREEVDSRVVTAPDELAFLEIATRELHRLGEFIGGRRYLDCPNVFVALGIEVARIVAAVNSPADDVEVGFVLALRLRLLGLCRILNGFRLSRSYFKTLRKTIMKQAI